MIKQFDDTPIKLNKEEIATQQDKGLIEKTKELIKFKIQKTLK